MPDKQQVSDEAREAEEGFDDLELRTEDADEVVAGDGQVYCEVKLQDIKVSN